MRVCGIELKGNDAIIICLEGDFENNNIILDEQRKINLKDSLDQKSVIDFSESINEFLDNNEFDQIGIKARATKGRFSGGSVSFKMEGIIQTSNVDVEIIHGATIKAALKNIDLDDKLKEILAYQKEAYSVAIYLLKSPSK